jgi:transketolase
LRINRKEPLKIYAPGTKFTIGKGMTLRDGDDVTLIASGIMVAEALHAAELLEEQGVRARVVNIFTLKPIDKDLIVSCAQETGAIVTCENHNIINGLGSAVAEVLAENHPVPLERVGVQDFFGEVGPLDYLQKRFAMTAEDIVQKAQRCLSRKDKGV